MNVKNNTYARRRAANPARRRQAQRKRILNILILLVVVIAACAIGLAEADEQRPGYGTVADECLLSVTVPDTQPEECKQYTGFFVSFNSEKHVPNYVSWILSPDETSGDAKRNNDFRPDPDIDGCATLADYKGSGFDRGHMAPAADMKWSQEAMSQCHYMTNMCPQDHGLNGGRWNTLENQCRAWALRDSDLVIIAGPVLTDVLPRSIGDSRVAVPERFFKVIFAPYANPPRAIGFIMPNSPVSDRLEDLAVSVDQIEEISGLDFLACLPDSIENIIEAKANYRDWTRRKR